MESINVTLDALRAQIRSSMAEAEKREAAKQSKPVEAKQVDLLSESDRFDAAFETVKRESGYRYAAFNGRKTFEVKNAKELFNRFVTKYFGDGTYKPQAWHSDLVDWLTDNRGKWLLICGNCGVGKTVFTVDFIKVLSRFTGKDVSFINSDNIAHHFERVYQKSDVISIDDVGKEEPMGEYGRLFNPVEKLIYWAYNSGTCLIMSTNLRPDQLKEKYGERVYDRIKGTAKIITIEGESFRTAGGIDAVEYGNQTPINPAQDRLLDW